MHSLALITLDIPRTEEQIEINTRIDKEIEKMELEVKKNPENYVMRFCWERYNNLRTEFSRKVQIEMESLMGRYSTETETPAYLEFCDMTEALQKEYSGTTDCLKLPQGLIAPTNSSAYLCRFVVRDGKVYEKHAGPANQERRTKRAKRIRAVCDYPLRKLYPDFGRFVEEWGGYDFYESQNAYGYYYNPQGEWDGYSIGGRWPYMLLVKADCSEYSPGEKSLLHEQKAAKVPEGYKWASAARKKDIA